MDISAIRLANLRAIIDSTDGGRATVAAKLDMAYPLLSAYIGKNPSKKIGDTLARRVEVAYGLAFGWMDKQHGEIETKAEVSGLKGLALALVNEITHLAQMGALSDAILTGLLAQVRAYAPQKTSDKLMTEQPTPESAPRVNSGESPNAEDFLKQMQITPSARKKQV